MFRKAVIVTAIALGAALSSPQGAAAGPIYAFDCITTAGASCTAGEAQFRVEVNDAGAGQVSFKFTNTAVIASSITDIYFADGTLLGISAVGDSAGVNFEQGATPASLPGASGATPPFVTTAGFTADSESGAGGGVFGNGVSAPLEFVIITFNLINGKTYSDTLAAINSGSGLRIGIVGQFPASGDASFVNVPTEVVTTAAVPEPTSLLLLATGLGGALRMRRKRATAAR